MPGSLPLPVKVAAKVVTSKTNVPELLGDPFDKKAVLEQGIHIHWALPDRLTRAKLVTDQGSNVSVFPGVPDLWLVVRFNPCVAVGPGSPLPPKRLWRAWVVDSVAQTATDLAAWTPPAPRGSKNVHTMAGLLPSAAGINHPGYGILAAGQSFDTAVAAYYPASRKRFGFYDNLSDLAGQKGTVTYAVVGWYSELGWDPLYSSPARGRMLSDWKVAHHTRSDLMAEAPLAAQPAGSTISAPGWMPRSVKMSEAPAPSAAKIQVVKAAAARGGAQTARAVSLGAMQKNFPLPDSSSTAVMTTVDNLFVQSGPEKLLCHGAIVEVPLTGSQTVGAKLADADVHLYPSIKRAMAEIASAGGSGDPKAADFVEMLLQDVDSQKHSVSGVVDMPGAIHGLSFQGVPGKSRFYARIEVVPPDPPWKAPAYFDVVAVPVVQTRTASGHWPLLEARSASCSDSRLSAKIPPSVKHEPPPTPPTQAELDQWPGLVRDALTKAAGIAQGKGKTIDPNLIYVADKRTNAQSLQLGRTADRSGTEGSGWWLDATDTNALIEFRKSVAGAVIHLPDAGNLHEAPGARWHRPWSPQLVLHGISRSYRAGFDGRFSADGYLRARVAGESLRGLSVGSSKPVLAKDLIDNTNNLFSVPGLPSDARLLVQETMLFDPSNSALMGAIAAGAAASDKAKATMAGQFQSAVRGMWLSRDPVIAATKADQLDALGIFGEMLDNNATAYWQDPRDPLFVDAKYAYLASPMSTGWTLNEDEVEFRRIPGTPASPKVYEFSERTKVSASIPKILDSALVKRESLNFKGDLVRAQDAPSGIKEDTFLKMDVVTAPLVKCDAALFKQGERERSGALSVAYLELVDVFGIVRTFTPSQVPSKAVGNPALPYWTDLTPRLPYWSRLQFRLQSAKNTKEEATPVDPPICGVLVPDFVEHALEVFDGNGKAIGQLTTDHRRADSPAGAPLNVRWQLHPWVASELNLPPDDVSAIQNDKLRAMVTTLLTQSSTVGANPTKWYETGLSAMMRIIDTVRGTLDPSVKTHDRRIRLLGEPILLLAGRLQLQSTAENSPTVLAGTDPAPLSPVLPQVKVRVGDVTRPDDGVLGCFLEKEGQFAPVSMQAKDKALLNLLHLTIPIPGFSSKPHAEAASHPFIANHPAEFNLTQNDSLEVLVLADARGGLYATSGVLPRKKINLPREFMEAALHNLEPTFQVGPIMTTARLGAVKPFVPPPQIEGYGAEFVYRRVDEQTHVETFPDTKVAPMPPLGELPNGRAVLSDGWIRVFKSK